MKKIVLSLMFMIISLGLFGAVLTINSVDFYGSSGVGDYQIASGESCVIVIDYTATDVVLPFLLYTEIDSKLGEGGSVNYTYVSTSGFDSSIGTNVVDTLSFTMPSLSGDAISDDNFEIYVYLEDGNNNPRLRVSDQSITDVQASYLDNTLPVELSSFDAVLLSTNDGVKLDWVVESESGVSGYYIYRNTLNDLESAIQIPAFIPSLNVEQQHTYSFTDYEIENNTQYFYWLKSIDLSNEFEFFGPVLVTIGSTNGDNDTPDYFYGTDLYANYPNPFNPTTTISYSVDNPQHVNISVYNVKGQLVKVLLDQQVTDAKVKHSVNWNGTDSNRNKVSSGIYFTVMKTRDDVKTNKMVLSK